MTTKLKAISLEILQKREIWKSFPKRIRKLLNIQSFFVYSKTC
jgi:hypothetical protein